MRILWWIDWSRFIRCLVPVAYRTGSGNLTDNYNRDTLSIPVLPWGQQTYKQVRVVRSEFTVSLHPASLDQLVISTLLEGLTMTSFWQPHDLKWWPCNHRHLTHTSFWGIDFNTNSIYNIFFKCYICCHFKFTYVFYFDFLFYWNDSL